MLVYGENECSSQKMRRIGKGLESIGSAQKGVQPGAGGCASHRITPDRSSAKYIHGVNCPSLYPVARLKVSSSPCSHTTNSAPCFSHSPHSAGAFYGTSGLSCETRCCWWG